jgi:hypothetical protein
MILSRVWYVLVGLAVAVAMYVCYVAVGQFDRQGTRSLKEGLASDSQTVEWALKIDARRRLDALLVGSVDATLQQALVAANGVKPAPCPNSNIFCPAKLPDPTRASAKKALDGINNAIPADYRDDALFAVDRDGQVVAQLGYDTIAGNDEFDMGGYPAVNDALHGWLRDDVWLLGSKMYVVVARPVEYDAAQRPAGAIVGLKEVNERFVTDLAKRTRTAIAFYAAGLKVAGGAGVEGFDAENLDAVATDLGKVDDTTYGDGGRSDVRMLTDNEGVMYARLPGDVWSLGGGFAVARVRTPLGGPMGFLSSADDKDKANVPWALLAGIVVLASLIGIGFSIIEHTLPLRELVLQAERFKAGAMEKLAVSRFRGAYRLAAQNVNLGMERVIENSGGVTRKPADLESIIGPVPAQPAMSAFSFPLSGSDGAGAPQAPAAPPPHVPHAPPPAAPAFAPPPAPVPQAPPPMRAPPPAPPVAAAPVAPAPSPPVPTAPVAFAPPRPPPPAPSRPNFAPPAPPALPVQPPAAPPPFVAAAAAATKPATPPAPAAAPAAALAARPAPPPPAPILATPPPSDEDDEATMVGHVPPEVLAQATGEHRPADDAKEWVAVYEDFIRTKKQCGEPVEGLTFEKFSHTLKKNRDALVQRHGCKHVKFSVYVKEGRASLKATPVKD